MVKLEAFKALAEGKKVRPIGLKEGGYFYLDGKGNIIFHAPRFETNKNYWNDTYDFEWEIYEPPKKKVKKKVKAWIDPDELIYWKDGEQGSYIFFSYKTSIHAYEIEFEIEVPEDE